MCGPDTAQTVTPAESYGYSALAQGQWAPWLARRNYQVNSQYSPLYTQMNLQNLNTFLEGNGNTPGYISLYEHQIAPAAARATVNSNRLIREGNMTDIQSLLPEMTQATREQNPQGAGLLDQLSNTAAEQLGYGTQLTPSQRLQLNQSVRAGQAARGMGFGPSDVFNESLDATNLGQQLLTQRQNEASNVVGQTEGFYGNNIATLLGENANMNTAQGISGTGSGSLAPSMLSNIDPTAVANNFASNATQTNLSNSQQSNQMMESMMGGFEHMGSSMMGGM